MILEDGRVSEQGRRAELPLVLAVVPDGLLPFEHLHPGAPERRDGLSVARVGPLVGAEVENPQARISSTSASARSRSGTRSSWRLVISSVIRPREKN